MVLSSATAARRLAAPSDFAPTRFKGYMRYSVPTALSRNDMLLHACACAPSSTSSQEYPLTPTYTDAVETAPSLLISPPNIHMAFVGALAHSKHPRRWTSFLDRKLGIMERRWIFRLWQVDIPTGVLGCHPLSAHKRLLITCVEAVITCSLIDESFALRPHLPLSRGPHYPAPMEITRMDGSHFTWSKQAELIEVSFFWCKNGLSGAHPALLPQAAHLTNQWVWRK